MILGLTGSIASGKSFVAACFADLGAVLVSADLLAREAVAAGTPALKELTAVFGSEILNAAGELDRAALAQRVFADPAERERLESIVHPAIACLAECRLKELNRQGHALIVYEAPLLFEAQAEGRVDQSLVVLVEPTVQLERLKQRDRLTEAEARARIAAQWPQADKATKAEFLIDNSGTEQQTRRDVIALYDYLLRTASAA